MSAATQQAPAANAANGEQQQQGSTYVIRPNFQKKFRPQNVKQLIHDVLHEKLNGKVYVAEETTELCKQISEELKQKMRSLELDRYKFAVQCVIGEQRGGGVKMGCRCFWDSDNDNYVQDIFVNDSIFAIAVVFGVYFY